MSGRAIALAGVLALAALQYLWYAVLFPIRGVDRPWLAATIIAAPLLAVLLLAALRVRSAAFWGSLLALLYFSHGVMEAWTVPAVAGLAWTEIALSLAIVLGASWNGVRARFSRDAAAAKPQAATTQVPPPETHRDDAV